MKNATSPKPNWPSSMPIRDNILEPAKPKAIAVANHIPQAALAKGSFLASAGEIVPASVGANLKTKIKIARGIRSIGKLHITAAKNIPIGKVNRKIRFHNLFFVNQLVCLAVAMFVGCLNSLVKSSISIISNCWFKTYNFIIPKYPNVLKRIMYLWLALSLCFPWNGAYATEAELSSTNELTEYIKLVEKDNSIPRGLLLAIAKTESNINPYAINVNGKAVFANSMQEAVFVAKRALARGITNVDIGVMQVNYRWHKERFRSIEKMLDPKINIQYAGNLLSSLFKQHGTWHKAIRYYHSANYEHHRKYSKKVVMAWLGGRKTNG